MYKDRNGAMLRLVESESLQLRCDGAACGKTLFGTVKYCPYCGAIQGVVAFDQPEDEPAKLDIPQPEPKTKVRPITSELKPEVVPELPIAPAAVVDEPKPPPPKAKAAEHVAPATPTVPNRPPRAQYGTALVVVVAAVAAVRYGYNKLSGPSSPSTSGETTVVAAPAPPVAALKHRAGSVTPVQRVSLQAQAGPSADVTGPAVALERQFLATASRASRTLRSEGADPQVVLASAQQLLDQGKEMLLSGDASSAEAAYGAAIAMINSQTNSYLAELQSKYEQIAQQKMGGEGDDLEIAEAALAKAKELRKLEAGFQQ